MIGRVSGNFFVVKNHELVAAVFLNEAQLHFTNDVVKVQ